MGWLLFAPVLPIGRMRRLAFFASFLITTAAGYGVARYTNYAVLLAVVFLWPQVCIHARRLHDIGASAFWMLLPWSVEGVCFLIGGFGLFAGIVAAGGREPPGYSQGMATLSEVATPIGAFGLAVAAGVFLFLSFWPSSQKAKYGPPIGAPKTAATVA